MIKRLEELYARMISGLRPVPADETPHVRTRWPYISLVEQLRRIDIGGQKTRTRTSVGSTR